MSIRLLATFGVVVIAAVFAVTAWAWFQIPASAQIPTHWNVHGEVNGHMNKAMGLWLVPALMTGITLFFAAITRIEPRQNNLARSRGLFTVGWIGVLAISALTQGVIIAASLGVRSPVAAIFPPAIAVFVIILGNAMPKSRSNFFFGIRTPWTLESDYSWEKTHRWVGRFFVLTGIATLAAIPLFGDPVAIWLFCFAMLVSAVAGVVLSYVFWRRDPERHAHDSVPG